MKKQKDTVVITGAEKVEIGVSEDTYRDLQQLGLPMPKNLKVYDRAEKTDYVVCTDFSMPLILPDNATGNCTLCGKPVQFRPHSITRGRPICVDCYNLLATSQVH